MPELSLLDDLCRDLIKVFAPTGYSRKHEGNKDDEVTGVLRCEKVLRVRQLTNNRCSSRFYLFQCILDGLVALSLFSVGVVIGPMCFVFGLRRPNRLELFAYPENTPLVGEALQIELRNVMLGLDFWG